MIAQLSKAASIHILFIFMLDRVNLSMYIHHRESNLAHPSMKGITDFVVCSLFRRKGITHASISISPNPRIGVISTIFHHDRHYSSLQLPRRPPVGLLCETHTP